MPYTQINQGVALYIINSEGIVYHQHEVLYIINSEGIVYHQAADRYTLARDEIQGRHFAVYLKDTDALSLVQHIK